MWGASFAATISGTVTNASTSAAVAYQKVYFYNPTTYYRDSTQTNASGYYSITIPSWIPLYDSVNVYTYACGSVVSYGQLYTGSSLTRNFNICVTYTLHGTISLSGTSNNGFATVYLIKKEYDSTLKDTVLTAIDSITTSSTGGTYTKTYSTNPFLGVLAGGALLLKAALKPSHPSYSSYVPTYYTSALVWSNAAALTAANFTPATATNINMVAGTNIGGPGFVGGSVLLGAGKNAGIGDPLRSRILILTNSTGQGLAYAYSDTAGRFSFSNLALGTYKIFGDAWGKTNPALTFTLTSARPSIPNIIFEENSTSFKGTLIQTTGIAGSTLSAVSAYPNPVNDYLFFSGLSSISGPKTVILYDVTGVVLQQRSFSTGQEVNIATAALPAGVYLLRLQTDAGAASFRVVK
jgi:hypothetical protein